MSLGELIVYLVVGLICGLIGQALVGRSIGGYVVSTVVGVIGALLGGSIARALGAPEPFRVSIGDQTVPLLWAIIGSAVITFFVAGVQRRRRASGTQ